MNEKPAPNFNESVQKFRQYLADNGYPRDIVWVTFHDVIFTDGRLAYVKVPVLLANEAQARKRFERGMTSQMGVLFATVCAMAETTCCYVWVPKNETQGIETLQPKDVKMSVANPISRIQGKPISSIWLWCYLRLRYLRWQGHADPRFLTNL